MARWKGSPCYECCQRSPTCHIDCPVYRAYSEEAEARRQAQYRKNAFYGEFVGQRTRIIKMQIRKSRK